MELQRTGDQRAIIGRFTPQHTLPQVHCFACGKSMQANSLGKCADCIATTVDITEGAQKEGSIVFCKDCGRVSVPPNQWIVAERESRELLAILVKRLDLGSKSVKLTDAEFLWTEPHSRRTKLRITLQKDESGVILEQSYEIEFVESTFQCPQCAKSYTHNKWVANVQIRQHAPHKKTILWLEQVMLKGGVQKSISSIEESREGLDLHYSFQRDAEKAVQFLQQNAPIRLTKSSQLVSTNTHTGKSSYKFTYSVELAPICREDLVIIPSKFSQVKGGMARLVLCHKLNSNLHFVDPNSCRTTFIKSVDFWRSPFPSLASSRANELSEFLVLDTEITGVINGKFVLADVTIAKTNDMSQEILVRTHLGAILHEGDTVLGHDLRTAQFNNEDWDSLKTEEIPEVILVRKIYPDKQKKAKARKDRKPLQRMVAEYNDGSVDPNMGSDYEEFLNEVDELSDIEVDTSNIDEEI